MNTPSAALAFLFLAWTAAGGPVAAQDQMPVAAPPPASMGPSALASPAPADSASITNTGSTNTAPFTITIERNGKATVSINGGTPSSVTVAKKLVDKLFADIAATPALASITNRGCMKSASFGTSTLLAYGGHVTPDLSCAGDAHGMALYSDVRAIESAVSIPSMMPSRRMIQ